MSVHWRVDRRPLCNTRVHGGGSYARAPAEITCQRCLKALPAYQAALERKIAEKQHLVAHIEADIPWLEWEQIRQRIERQISIGQILGGMTDSDKILMTILDYVRVEQRMKFEVDK